ncbi:MAG: hypothetical protein SGI88_17575 [Candidatus Hydrogenedentes bacterium]|nr:hypothetical protein [Candidatus Hydrogenedentota bacterium]
MPEHPYGGDRGFKQIECVSRYPKPFSLPGPKNSIGWERFHVHSAYNFINAIVTNAPTKPDILDGAKTQAILEAALDSSAQRAWVTVPTV